MVMPGDVVLLPEGGAVTVLDVDGTGLVRVQLDGESTGTYHESQLRESATAAPADEEEA